MTPSSMINVDPSSTTFMLKVSFSAAFGWVWWLGGGLVGLLVGLAVPCGGAGWIWLWLAGPWLAWLAWPGLLPAPPLHPSMLRGLWSQLGRWRAWLGYLTHETAFFF